MRTTLTAAPSEPTTATSMMARTEWSARARPETFVLDEDVGGTIVSVKAKAHVFSQGAPADALFYVRRGLVRISVVSPSGKAAILDVASEGQFFGDSCLAGALVRVDSAIAVTDCELLRIEQGAMMRALQRNRAWADLFVKKVLLRNIRNEENLVDQLLNCSEKRLARTLLLLADFGHAAAPETMVLDTSQETLAEMVGTTRSRVNAFMNRFRALGYIDYGNGGLHVHRSLLRVVLR